MKHPLLVLLALLCISRGFSQPYFQRYDSIQVKIDGILKHNPWAGGLNFIQASSIDLNLDGIKDLFIFDRTGNKVRTFINGGTANTVDYTYHSEYENKFPPLHDWALLADYNCDGKEDIFSYSDMGGGFKVYKNTSDLAHGLQFTLVTPLQYSVYNPPNGSLINLYISSVDIPSITDIDNDGDLDVITFAITGTFMEYHQNQSMELYGTCDSLKFEMRNRCWGYAAESPLSNVFTLNDTCPGNVPDPQLMALHNNGEQRSTRHSGACELCIDLDGDADKEIIVGGISFNNLTMLTNGGTPTANNMVADDIAFPSNNGGSAAVNLTVFPCAYYVDVDNDGAKDLLVSPNAPNASENFNSVLLYKNVGTTSNPSFQFSQYNLLQDNMIDVGEGAYPVFFDYNNDGLKDLFIGDYGYYGSTGFKHKIAQFKNTGTATSPKFELITRDYLNLSALNLTNMVPTFGDMDADGDYDMIIGGYDGKLQYFQNIAPAGDTAQLVLVQANLRNSGNNIIDVGDFAAPQIVDIDNDGKNDVVVGRRNGKLAYFHHSGSPTATVPVLDSVTYTLGGVSVNAPGYVTGYSYPFFFKQNGVTKLLVGSESGYLNIYSNIDGNLSGSFNRDDSTYLQLYEGTRTAINGADINNDGYMDFIIGNYSGGVAFYKGVQNLVTTNDIVSTEHPMLWNASLFPNPANNNITLKITNSEAANYVVELFNVLGQTVLSEKSNGTYIQLNTSALDRGVYVCKITNTTICTINNSIVKRVIIEH